MCSGFSTARCRRNSSLSYVSPSAALLGRQRAVRAQDAPQEREGRAQRRGVAGARAGGAGGEGGGEAEERGALRAGGSLGLGVLRLPAGREVVEEILPRACGGPVGRRRNFYLISTAGSCAGSLFPVKTMRFSAERTLLPALSCMA